LALGWQSFDGAANAGKSALLGNYVPLADDQLKRIGAWTALVGVTVSIMVAWFTVFVQEPGEYRVDDAWAQAATVCAYLCLFSLGLGMAIAFMPELRRTGPFASRLLRAERRNLRAGRGLFATAAWAVMLGSGMVFFMVCAGYGFDGGKARSGMVFFFITPIIAFFGISLLVPVIVSASTAIGLASARRTGGARDLLLAPPTSESLGWAVVSANVLRGLFVLAAVLPYYAITLLVFAEESTYESQTPMIVTAIVLLPLGLLLEYWHLRAGAAVGAWAGAAVPVPAAAALIAAMIMVASWFVRLIACVICFAIGQEAYRGNFAEFWTWPALFVPACWCASAVAGKFFMWLCRRSMALPLSLRMGTWFLRNGDRLAGLSGEGVEGLGGIIAGIDPHVPRARIARDYKKGFLGVWLLAFAAAISMLIAGETARDFSYVLRPLLETRDVPAAANWLFYILFVVFSALSGGAVFLVNLIRRQIDSLKHSEVVR